MKRQYRYYVVGKWIIRVHAWQVEAHPGRYVTYHETREELWNRAKKYGYKTWDRT